MTSRQWSKNVIIKMLEQKRVAQTCKKDLSAKPNHNIIHKEH